MMRATSSSGARPVNSTCPPRPSSSRSATSSSKQSPEPISVKPMSSRPSSRTTMVGRPDHDVHAVLRAHDADVRGQVRVAPAQLRVRGPALELVRVRAGAHDGDVPGCLAAAAIAISGVGRVGGDDVVCGAERRTFQGQQAPLGQSGPSEKRESYSSGHRSWWSKTKRVVLRHREPAGDRPEDVRRVAGLQDVEPAPPGRALRTSQAVARNE